MSATNLQANAAEAEEAEDQSPNLDVPPLPDEDGPHGVPDSEVIEKTLPTTSLE